MLLKCKRSGANTRLLLNHTSSCMSLALGLGLLLIRNFCHMWHTWPRHCRWLGRFSYPRIVQALQTLQAVLHSARLNVHSSGSRLIEFVVVVNTCSTLLLRHLRHIRRSLPVCQLMRKPAQHQLLLSSRTHRLQSDTKAIARKYSRLWTSTFGYTST